MGKENEINRVLRAGMALALSVSFAACAQKDEAELDTPEESTPAVEQTETKTVDIEGVNSSISGEATLSRSAESIMVSLTLENLPGAGPYQGQLISGKCDAVESTTTPPTTPPSTTPPQTTPGMEAGRRLALLESIQVTGTAPQQTAMSHTTIPISTLTGNNEVAIKITGEGSATVACGDLDDLNDLISANAGTTGSAPYGGTTPSTPPAGTTPSGTTPPGQRP